MVKEVDCRIIDPSPTTSAVWSLLDEYHALSLVVESPVETSYMKVKVRVPEPPSRSAKAVPFKRKKDD